MKKLLNVSWVALTRGNAQIASFPPLVWAQVRGIHEGGFSITLSCSLITQPHMSQHIITIMHCSPAHSSLYFQHVSSDIFTVRKLNFLIHALQAWMLLSVLIMHMCSSSANTHSHTLYLEPCVNALIQSRGEILDILYTHFTR